MYDVYMRDGTIYRVHTRNCSVKKHTVVFYENQPSYVEATFVLRSVKFIARHHEKDEKVIPVTPK